MLLNKLFNNINGIIYHDYLYNHHIYNIVFIKTTENINENKCQF